MTITAAGGGQRLVVDGVGNGNFPSLTVTAGQMLVICILGYRNGTALTYAAGDITKGSGTATIGTVALDRSGTVDTGGGEYVGGGIYSVLVTGSGSLVLAYSGNSTYFYGYADIYNGSFDASRLEAGNHASSATDSTTSADSGNATTAGAGLFVAAFAPFSSTGSYTMTPDAAFTSVNSEADFANHMGGSIIRRIVSSGTTDSGSWTIGSANGGWFAAVAAYKEVAGGVTLNPSAASMSMTGAQPTVSVSGNQSVTPSAASLAMTGNQPSVSAQAFTWYALPAPGSYDSNSILAGQTYPTGSWIRVVTGFAHITYNYAAAEAAGELDNDINDYATAEGGYTGSDSATFEIKTPAGATAQYTVTANIQQGTVSVGPTAASMTMTGSQPSVSAGGNQSLTPGAASLVMTGNAPNVTGITTAVAPGAASMVMAGAQAQVSNASYTPANGISNQGNQQGAFRALALTTLDYNGDFIAAMRADIADDSGSINELMIRWLQQKLGSSNQSLPGLMAEAANDRGVSRWSEITNPLAIGS